MPGRHRTFDRSFKEEAVRLSRESGLSVRGGPKCLDTIAAIMRE